MSEHDYPVVIVPLAEQDGGGFLAQALGLPGCMSDGETREAAARNIADAIAQWLHEARRLGRPIPEPADQVDVWRLKLAS